MPAKPLFSKRYRISSKPDYIIKKDGHQIPVEVKTGQHYEPFDPKIRFELESAIKKMRHILKTKKTARNHNDLYKCKSCSMRNYCDKKII